MIAAGASLVACASVLGVQDGVLDTDASAPDAGADATNATDASPDTDAPVEAATDDSSSHVPDAAPQDGASTDGGCASRAPDDAHGVFVATAGTDLFDCGTRAAPCASIAQGLVRAAALGASTIYVSEGTYVGQVTLVAGITVEGGWSASWSPVCSPSGVTLRAPSTTNATVVADAIGGQAALRLLTLESKAAADVQPGESLYGVRATGTSTALTLDHVVVHVSSAGPGAAGTPGDGGAAASSGGCLADSGADGGPGEAGAQGTASFQSSGFVTAAGAGGATGEPGLAGSGGAPGACTTCLVNAQACFAQTCPSPPTQTDCADAGVAGCPGSGGLGGGPGQGGGSSVALFAWGATVTCTAVSLSAGAGGGGGAGGPGGPGSAGGAGLVGASSFCTPSCRLTGGGCVPGNPITLDGGGPGGTGGAGGSGGQGGGGAGGWSCATYSAADASVTLNGATLAIAEAGAPGAPNGPGGVAKEQCP